MIYGMHDGYEITDFKSISCFHERQLKKYQERKT